MELVQFYSILVVQLVSVLAGAGCLSVYLVSRRRGFLYAFWAFLFYFFDATLVFQDAFVALMMDIPDERVYLAARSVASIVSGSGIFVSLWLLACDFVGEKRKALLIAPPAIFAAASLASLLLDQAQPENRFVFYAMRAGLFLWTLGFLGVRYIATVDAAERQRMRRYKALYIVLWVLGLGFFIEDVYFFLIAPPDGGALSLFSAERNYLEELLMLVCAGAACRSAFQALSLRYEQPPCARTTGWNRSSTTTWRSTAAGISFPSASRRCCGSSCWASTTRTSHRPWAWRQARRRCTYTTSCAKRAMRTGKT